MARSSRVVGLDEGANAILADLAALSWVGARFLGISPKSGRGEEPRIADVVMHDLGTNQLHANLDLNTADLVVLVATTSAGAPAASLIGSACRRSHIMTAGLAVGTSTEVAEAVTALRPNAGVLVISSDPNYVFEMLTALRA